MIVLQSPGICCCFNSKKYFSIVGKKSGLFFYGFGNIINTTKIDEVVCPPNISETVAGRLMKLAHRQRIASTTIKFISKPILLSML